MQIICNRRRKWHISNTQLVNPPHHRLWSSGNNYLDCYLWRDDLANCLTWATKARFVTSLHKPSQGAFYCCEAG